MSTISWFLRRGSAACLTLLALGLSCDSTPEKKPPATGCTIAGTDYADNAVNPDDPCQSCQLSLNATAWTNLPDGLSCNQGNSVCTGGACRPGCYISGMFYAAPDLDPTNSCKICHPGESTLAWSDLPAGTACADGGICTGGNCQVGCYILGKVYPDRSDNPADPSLCCNRSGDPSAWSARLQGPTVVDLGGVGADIVAADFNGDGVADLAAVDLTNSWVSVLLSDGTGGFSPLQTYPTEAKPRALVALDLNGDGKPDLAVKSSGKKTIDVLINQGGGVFAGQVSYPAGNGIPGSMTSGDVDQDGHDDLICSQPEDGIVLFPGLGNGTLAAGIPVQDAGNGTVFAADINADKALDVVYNDIAGSSLSLLQGIGDGGFLFRGTLPLGQTPVDVILADLNGDSIPDIALSTSGDVELLFGDGMQFSAPVSFPVAQPPGGLGFADLNGSGTKALLVSVGGVGIIGNVPLPDGGTVQGVVNIVSVAGPSSRLAVGDFNGDHVPDVALLAGTGISVYLNGCP